MQISRVSLIGISVLLFYSVSKILQFYGIGESVYGVYILFYAFIVMLILLNTTLSILKILILKSLTLIVILVKKIFSLIVRI